MITEQQFADLKQRLLEFDEPQSVEEVLVSLWGEDDVTLFNRGMDLGYELFAQELRKMLEIK